ncbi:hypothetical protein AQUSIP_13080 [Aquicella siphonis]|uniref:Uncharacterized protein n=1 Tax=Aquicella siphonis TaxID=254247 RepID=A0A5E4PHS6_9COXI|nr:hypothetical protein [Aquicella siphonis]VVC76007.1 hypothetical protein AQUSIP_13080 [Aquicella siphonis]
MAKHDHNNTAQARQFAPNGEHKQAMPLERKEAEHRAARDPNVALLPGKSIALNNGLLGDIEAAILEAEKAGKYAYAGQLISIMNKYSALKHELIQAREYPGIIETAFYQKMMSIY